MRLLREAMYLRSLEGFITAAGQLILNLVVLSRWAKLRLSFTKSRLEQEAKTTINYVWQLFILITCLLCPKNKRLQFLI